MPVNGSFWPQILVHSVVMAVEFCIQHNVQHVCSSVKIPNYSSSYWYADFLNYVYFEQFKLIHYWHFVSKFTPVLLSLGLFVLLLGVAKNGGSLISARLTLKKLMCVKKRSKPGIKPHPVSTV